MRPSDVRKGDVVRFILKDDPRITFTSFAKEDWTAGMSRATSATLNTTVVFEDYDLELVERPLPPIDQELLKKAYAAYWERRGDVVGTLTAVINTVREHDKTNKQGANA